MKLICPKCKTNGCCLVGNSEDPNTIELDENFNIIYSSAMTIRGSSRLDIAWCSGCGFIGKFGSFLSKENISISKETEKEAENLRKLLWLNHGCASLYGDDGEMQCSKCLLDFKRDSIEKIKETLER
jgi:hypothetical protein